jgi:ubiquinone/menaquinone biosynthesis C-methylase UbiE
VSFDPLAPWYRTLETIAFGSALQRCRIALLDQVTPRRALIVGEGNGRFLCELLRRHPGVEVDCVDASERMLRLARERVEDVLGEGATNVQWLHQDITAWNPPEHHYDLLVAHFVLDCFAAPTLQAIVRKLARAATHEANWLLADFSTPESGFARLHAQVWLAILYRFFRLTTGIEAQQLVDATPVIQREGFRLVRQSLFRSGLLRSELWRCSHGPVGRAR